MLAPVLPQVAQSLLASAQPQSLTILSLIADITRIGGVVVGHPNSGAPMDSAGPAIALTSADSCAAYLAQGRDNEARGERGCARARA